MMIAGFIILLFGITVYHLARRGFAVGTHPFCAQCNFNLTGLPEEHARCPECGSNILAEGAIRIGYRRPVLAGMVTGAILILAGVGFFGVGFPRWWDRFDGSYFKRTIMLQREMVSPTQSTRRAAVGELSRRVRTGALSDAQLNDLAAGILKLQRDSGAAWDERWGDLLQAAHQQRKLPAGTWQKYLEQAVQVTVAVRPRVALDDALPLRVECRLVAGLHYATFVPATITPEVTFTQGGAGGASSMPVRMGPLTVEAFPKPLEWTNVVPARVGGGGGGVVGLDHAAPGNRTGRVAVTMSLVDAGGTRATVSKVVDVAYDVLPAGSASVSRHPPTNPEEVAEMQSAIRWRLTAPQPLAIKAGQTTPLGSLWISGPPVAAAFRVVLRQAERGGESGRGGREWLLARVLVRANEGTQIPLTLPIAATGTAPRPGAAELVCVPETDLAAGTVDVLEIWGDEVRRPVEIGE